MVLELWEGRKVEEAYHGGQLLCGVVKRDFMWLIRVNVVVRGGYEA